MAELNYLFITSLPTLLWTDLIVCFFSISFLKKKVEFKFIIFKQYVSSNKT